MPSLSNIEYDSTSWVQIPFEFPTRDGESVDEWVGRVAGEQRERGYKETRKTGTLDDYFRGLVTMAQDSEAEVSHDTFWALIAQDAPGFLMVTVDLEQSDTPFDEFVKLISAQRDNQYEPASVDPIELPNLGDGVRIVRRDFDENRELYTTLYFLFRRKDAYFMLSGQSFNPIVIDFAMPLCEELLAGATVEVD